MVFVEATGERTLDSMKDKDGNNLFSGMEFPKDAVGITICIGGAVIIIALIFSAFIWPDLFS